MAFRSGRAAGFACLFAVVMGSAGDASRPALPAPGQFPGFDRILKRPPALTTSFADAVYGVPFLDDFDPEDLQGIEGLERKSDGSITFDPGLYTFDVPSFCAQPGTLAPRGGGGEGYLYAPMKGPRAGVIRNVMRRGLEHPEIPQEDIQVLLWAILSYTKLSDMSRERQLLAARLLTPAELFELNGGALGLIPRPVLDRVLDAVPAPIRGVLEAETELRRLLTDQTAATSYADLERAAVLEGEAEDAGGENAPPGRWSLRPEGVFVRYSPYDYTRFRIDMYVPEPFRVRFDRLGRITLVEDGSGARIAAAYDDSIAGPSVAGEPSLKAYAFESIRFEVPASAAGRTGSRAEWRRRGWTFVGVPAGFGAAPTAAPTSFPGFADRYRWSVAHKAQIGNLDRQFAAHGPVDPAMNLGQFTAALKDVLASDDTEHPEWVTAHLDLARKAWQYAVWLREMYTDKPGEPEVESIGNDAVHRDPYRQRALLYGYFKQWGVHKILDPEFELIPRPLRRPMFITGRVI